MRLATYKLNKVYFAQIYRGNEYEKVIRKMILTYEGFIYDEQSNSLCLKRIFTIAGIGEVEHLYHPNPNKNVWKINGNLAATTFGIMVYTDLNGTQLSLYDTSLWCYITERFGELHNIELCGSNYKIYKWNGINAKYNIITITNIIESNTLYSLLTPSFSVSDFKEMGYYLTKEDCEDDNYVELIDFSF